MDARYYSGSDDRDLAPRSVVDEDACPHCEALPHEWHQEQCPLYLPLCKCGAVARRAVHGEWRCTTCAPAGKVAAA